VKVVGAGLPRTATSSQAVALRRLLGGPVLNMSAIPGHPFALGEPWDAALAGTNADWSLPGWVAAVDWPASLFWRELAAAHPRAIVLLSTRADARTWYDSVAATILPYARRAAEPDWTEGRGIARLFERFAGPAWDDPDTLKAAYDRHVAEVRRDAPPDRLVDWRPEDGWAPICAALGAPIPDEPFPWTNRREDWG
jgi:hypothetical protein